MMGMIIGLFMYFSCLVLALIGFGCLFTPMHYMTSTFNLLAILCFLYGAVNFREAGLS